MHMHAFCQLDDQPGTYPCIMMLTKLWLGPIKMIRIQEKQNLPDSSYSGRISGTVPLATRNG